MPWRLNGGTIDDSTGTPANLTLPAPASSADALACRGDRCGDTLDGFESGDFSALPWQLSHAGAVAKPTGPSKLPMSASARMLPLCGRCRRCGYDRWDAPAPEADSPRPALVISSFCARHTSHRHGQPDLRDRWDAAAPIVRDTHAPGSSRSSSFLPGSIHSPGLAKNGGRFPAAMTLRFWDDVQFTPGATLTIQGTSSSDQFNFDASGSGIVGGVEWRATRLFHRRFHQV